MIKPVASSRLRAAVIVLLASSLAPGFGYSQTPPVVEPLNEQLLNGLRVLLWPRPGTQDVFMKLRIHSGAAFDLAGKAGEMSLLGDILFPDPATVEFFTDEMGGKLDVETDFDSLTITIQGRAAEFERIVEILRNALTTPQITPEIIARQRDRRIKIIRDTSVSPAVVADRAIAKRLFGDYPYGRPSAGSVDHLAAVDRADLLLVRERFLNPNNATLTIVGGVERNRALRALRQLLGSWRKSEQIVPATFRQPGPPDSRTLVINGPADRTAEVRLAVRGLARSDTDHYAATILALVARERWLVLAPELNAKPFFVRHEAHFLPGMFLMGAAVDSKSPPRVIATATKTIDSLLNVPFTVAELAQARNEILAQVTNRLGKPETMVDPWLDADTFHLPSVTEQLRAWRDVSAADLQRAANRLFRGAQVASIVLGDAEQLRAALEGHVQIETAGESIKPNQNQSELKAAPKPNTATKPF